MAFPNSSSSHTWEKKKIASSSAVDYFIGYKKEEK